MSTFEELVESRKAWIETVLKPWCYSASLKELKKADMEWGDIAGKVDADHTLWMWAWSRFPDLVHEGLNGVNEAYEVRVTLKTGSAVVGYPDSSQSQKGKLKLHVTADVDAESSHQGGPYTIDEIAAVERIGA